MKKFRLILLLLAAAWSVEAATITVSNDPDNPGQYDDLQAAVDAASAGDTILVSPSGISAQNRPLSYGSVIINKKLAIIGPGINEEVSGEYAIIASIILTEQGPTLPDASGTLLSGLVILGNRSGELGFSQVDLNDIIVEKCVINFIQMSTLRSRYNNLLFKNCIINSMPLSFDAENSSNILFSNNIIQGTVGGFSTGNVFGNMFLRNNVFIAENNDPERFNLPLRNMKNLILENNIFWAWEPGGCTDCTFTNNLTYANFNNELIGANSNNPGSVGSGNIINQDPQFVKYDGGVFEYTDDFNLQTGSPAIGAGISGVDMGIYGGSYPWNIDVATIVPEVTSLTITESSVPEDGQLEFTFSAEKQ